MGSSKKEKRRSEKKSKNSSTKPVLSKRDDGRGKSPSRHGKLMHVSLSKRSNLPNYAKNFDFI